MGLILIKALSTQQHFWGGGLHHDWGLYAGEVAEKNITGSSFMGVVTTPPHPLPCMYS